MNTEIREAAHSKKVKLWRIADKLGINDGNFSRKLRHELDESEKMRIMEIINALSKEGE